MTRPSVRVALLGYGLSGAVFHTPLISSVPGLRIGAVVTADPERAARARAENEGAAVFASAEEVWRHRDDFDLVVVAAPNRTHVRLALEALAAGLAVVVDKPMATSAADARRMIDVARRAGRLLTVFQNRRWDGDVLTLQRLVREGAIGRVLRFESRFERWRPAPKRGWRESAAPEDAGGVLYDLGSHLIDQALYLFGPAIDVYAEIDRRRPGAEVDDDVFVALAHTSGVRSHVWASWVAAQCGPRMRVLGDRAGYVKHGLDAQEEALRAGRRPDEAGWGEEPPERWGLLGTEGDVRPVRTEPGAYRDFYVALLDALRRDGPPPVDPEDAAASLRVLEAARRSAAERRVIGLRADGA